MIGDLHNTVVLTMFRNIPTVTFVFSFLHLDKKYLSTRFVEIHAWARIKKSIAFLITQAQAKVAKYQLLCLKIETIKQVPVFWCFQIENKYTSACIWCLQKQKK